MGEQQIRFRRARETDLPAIISLLAADELGQQRENPSLPLAKEYEDAFQAVRADENQLLAVAVCADDTVVGTLQISFLPGLSRKGAWRGQIEAVRVAQSHRGSGLGQKMFQWAIAECQARGCSLVQLTSDNTRSDAHKFYEKLGFVASHVGYKLKL